MLVSPIFELKLFQSVEVRSPVVPLQEFAIEKLTFGHTLDPVPLLTESAGVAELIFPKVSAFCFPLKVFQSARERAPVDEVPASPRLKVEPVTVSPLLGAETLILPSFELNVFQSVEVKSPVTQLVAFAIEKLTFGHTLAPVPLLTESAGVAELIFPKISAFCFPLKVFQSALERYPFVPVVACEILNTHEPEL